VQEFIDVLEIWERRKDTRAFHGVYTGCLVVHAESF
jgi:hypothetical protein